MYVHIYYALYAFTIKLIYIHYTMLQYMYIFCSSLSLSYLHYYSLTQISIKTRIKRYRL